MDNLAFNQDIRPIIRKRRNIRFLMGVIMLPIPLFIFGSMMVTLSVSSVDHAVFAFVVGIQSVGALLAYVTIVNLFDRPSSSGNRHMDLLGGFFALLCFGILSVATFMTSIYGVNFSHGEWILGIQTMLTGGFPFPQQYMQFW